MRSRELAAQVSSLAKGFVLISVSIVWAYSLLDHISAIVSYRPTSNRCKLSPGRDANIHRRRAFIRRRNENRRNTGHRFDALGILY